MEFFSLQSFIWNDIHLNFGVTFVPIVQIEMWEGRTVKQKEKLIKGITKAFEEIGVQSEWLTIIIHDVPKSNWGMRGEQASNIEP